MIILNEISCLSSVTSPYSFANSKQVALFTAVICFAAYTCIFAFRKAFNVASYAGLQLWGLDYKVMIVITQVFGYMLSKFYGIKFISELNRFGRGRLILILVVVSWFAWLVFALVPPPYNFWVLLFNGFPLGMLWGVLFSYVEGRRATDFIGAALAVSFIFASGLAKSTAQYVMNTWGVNEYWMPFVTGLIFFVPLLLFIYLLEKIPPPSADDVMHRMERVPMPGSERRKFVRLFFPGIFLLVLIYVLATMLREVRDGFMADMWIESGETFKANVFAQTETIISLAILAMIATMVVIRNNLRAFLLSHWIMLAGFVLSGIVTLLFLQHAINMFYWITLVGLGLYMTYIPYNSMLFDRLLAAFRYTGTVGFLIYVADAFGYLASVGVLLTKTILNLKINWLNFYINLVLWAALIGIVATFFSMLYFRRKHAVKLNG